MESDVRAQLSDHTNATSTPDNTTCPEPWQPPDNLATMEFILPIIVLILFNSVVIIGNTLVVISVFTHTKLRTVTNTFIVSLAVADLLLGVAVLPFSSANEVLRYWPFGTTWCNIWLAIDVWVCTASILNLCAISLDRYLAISRPFKYPRLMSYIRARILVASVWIVSFIVCFPPLIGWKETSSSAIGSDISESSSFINVSNVSSFGGNVLLSKGVPRSIILSNMTRTYTLPGENKGVPVQVYNSSWDSAKGCLKSNSPTCVLTSEPGYIIYSALCSFWIPMCIMVFFYWKIYRAATKTTSAIRRGVLTTKTSYLHSSSPDNQVTLRIHRGGGNRKMSPHSPEESFSSCRLLDGSTCRSSVCSADSHYLHRANSCEHSNGAPKRTAGSNEHSRSRNGFLRKNKRQRGVRITFSKCDSNTARDSCSSERLPLRSTRSLPDARASRTSARNSHTLHNGTRVNNIEESEFSVDDTSRDTRSSAGFLNKVSKIQLKTHIKRINKEKKAAKTVGIIVGCFIVCWAPFFTVYLLGAFCPGCTPDILFIIFFWLGYCNSAVNPFLYAMCSKDFRYAFKKLLRCRVERRRVERTNTRFMTFINSIRIQISSRGSDSNSE